MITDIEVTVTTKNANGVESVIALDGNYADYRPNVSNIGTKTECVLLSDGKTLRTTMIISWDES